MAFPGVLPFPEQLLPGERIPRGVKVGVERVYYFSDTQTSRPMLMQYSNTFIYWCLPFDIKHQNLTLYIDMILFTFSYRLCFCFL